MTFGTDRRRFLIAMSSVAVGIPLQSDARDQTFETMNGDLIVLLPGIMGTALTAQGRAAWSPSLAGVSRAILTLGASLTDLRLADDSDVSDGTDDGVRAEQVVDDIHLIPGLWRIDGYTRLFRTLSALPGVTPGTNLLTFPYDWRKDNRIAAGHLARQVHAWLQRWRIKSGNSNARVVLVAHSMGGLVSRYYLECLEGWKSTRKLITFGTPFRGSVNALDVLHRGIRVGPAQLESLSTLLRSFTSVYQLLPTYPCINDDGTLKRVIEVAGIDNLNPIRVLAALKFHQEIEDAVTANSSTEAYLRSGYQIHPIVGISQKTKQFVRRDGSSLNMLSNFEGTVGDGDGTVPRPSATPLEISGRDREMFISENHSSLQNSEISRLHLTGLLTSASIDWDAYRSRSGGKVSLTVPDVATTGKKTILQGNFDADIYHRQVKLLIAELYSGRKIFEKILIGDAEGNFGATLPALPAGAYRVTAVFTSARRPASSVSDVMAVLLASALP